MSRSDVDGLAARLAAGASDPNYSAALRTLLGDAASAVRRLADERDSYLRLRDMSGDRYRRVTDLVFQHLASGDVDGLLEAVGDIANGCDYVDDEMIALFDRAKARWGAPRTNDELLAESEAAADDQGQVTP